MDREWPWGIGAVILMTALWVSDPGGLIDRGREAAFEIVGEMFPRRPTSRPVAVIDIDRESLARVAPWPWRRADIARLVQRVAEDEPKAIAIDILLSGEDRKGPEALARELGRMSGRAGELSAGFESDDRALASAIAAAGNVVLGIVLDDRGEDAAPIPPPFAVEGTTADIAPRSSAGLLAPYEPLAAGAAGFGVLSFQDGPLGRVATAPLFAVAAGEVFPGFAVEAARVAEAASLLILKADSRNLAVGPIETPVDRNAEMRLHVSAPDSWGARTIPAWTTLMETSTGAPEFTGKIVLIGSSAPESGAFLPVVGAGLVPTVQIQAEAIEQILSGDIPIRTEAAMRAEALAMAILGLTAVVVAVLLPPGWAALAAFGLVGSWLLAAARAFLAHDILLDPTGPAAAIIVAGNVTAFAAFTRTRALKAAILQKFERYVPPEVVARLVRDPRELRLDGELREVTALITDVEGFSRMTENCDPRTLVGVLDGYFDGVTELIVNHGGMVDKIVGDAVLAFFNIPAPLRDHTEAAVRCALAIGAWTEDFRGRPDAAAIGFARTRSGIEAGVAIVGDVGGRRRLDYTAYGVVVNKAARFQEANKMLGSTICIGPVAAGMLKGRIPLRPLGKIVVRGMDGRCEVAEPWGAAVPEEVRAAYTDAVAAQETAPERARELFAALAARLPDDAIVKAWMDRIAEPKEPGPAR
ncbi:MAG: adenylate/guanylate cyclase domain-containing protein [Pseudomonadota bacterium]|nr:adenylate/guanylate cyclase domain-containing protein [Pseudomonadota bacterium]